MKKRIFSISVIVLVVVLALFSLAACDAKAVDGDNLIVNGDFETVNAGTDKKITFDNWYTKSTSYNSTDNKEEDTEKYGVHSLTINNSSSSTNEFLYQEIKVDRKKIYKVSYDVKVSNYGSEGTIDRGAYISFKENPSVIFKNEKVKTGWVTRTFYVRPMDTDYLTICLNLNTNGEVSYDNVSMNQVAKAPAGETVEEFYKSTVARYNSNAASVAFVVLLSLLTIALVVGLYIALRKLFAADKPFINFGSSVSNGKKGKTKVVTGGKVYEQSWFILTMLLLGTFLLRLIGLLVGSFGTEINKLVGYSRILSTTDGVLTAYATNADIARLSPGTVFILAIIGNMGENLPMSSVGILIRMIGVLGDMAIVAMIYLYGKKYVGNKFSTIYAALYAVLPLSIIMSSVTGGFESMVVALMMLTIILAVEKQYLPTYLVYTLTFLLDIRALAIAPILVVYFGYQYFRDDDNKRKFTANRAMIIFGFIGVFFLFYLLTLPIAFNEIKAGAPFANWTAYANIIVKNNIFVSNALNLYGMVGMNMKMSNSMVSILNLLFILVFEIYAVSLYFKNKNKQEIFLISSFTLAVIAVFTLKVNYTYLFLAIALGWLYTMISGDKRMYGVMSMYSVLGFLGVGQIINHSGFLNQGVQNGIINFETLSPDFIAFSLFAVLTTLYYVYVSYQITSNANIKDIYPMKNSVVVTFKNWCSRINMDVQDLFKPNNKED